MTAVYPEDGGTRFGTWGDRTSLLLYEGVMPLLLSQVELDGVVGDYGGANGLLRRWVPGAITVDRDPSKHPDVLDDVVHHTGVYDVVVMRYLLHYLTDTEVRTMLCTVRTDRVVLVQFTNEGDELTTKRTISAAAGESPKHLRTLVELVTLFCGGWTLRTHVQVTYRVHPEFYENRLGVTGAPEHGEAVQLMEWTRRHPTEEHTPPCT